VEIDERLARTSASRFSFSAVFLFRPLFFFNGSAVLPCASFHFGINSATVS
jgi:hypothetical protein